MATLKSVRKAKGMIQKEVAEQLGISRATYNRYENDFGSMTVEMLNKFCKVMGANPQDFFVGYDFTNAK